MKACPLLIFKYLDEIDEYKGPEGRNAFLLFGIGIYLLVFPLDCKHLLQKKFRVPSITIVPTISWNGHVHTNQDGVTEGKMCHPQD
jgi:hypothetical protein